MIQANSAKNQGNFHNLRADEIVFWPGREKDFSKVNDLLERVSNYGMSKQISSSKGAT